jgi:predicted PurR-regulated permease PerM
MIETRVVSLTFGSAVRIGVAIFVAIFLIALARNIPDTLTRGTLGIIFALGLDPLVVRLCRFLHCSRGSAVAIVGVLATASTVLLLAVVGPSAIRQAESSSSELPQTVDKLMTLPVVGDVLQHWHADDRIRSWAGDLPQRIDDESITHVVESLVGGLVAGITVLVVGVAVLSDGETLVRRLQYLVPRQHRAAACRAGRVFYRTIGAYFAGSLLVAGIAATFVLVLGLSLGVPLAPVAALWVLVVNFIPQIGGFLAASLFTALAFAKSPGTAVVCLILYVIYMNVENHVIQPAIVGNAIDLSAAATMLAALIGGAAGGVPGAILATPLVGTAKALYIELKDPGRAPPPRRRQVATWLERAQLRRVNRRSRR